MDPVITWMLLPIGLGLVAFIEPCSVGASLLFIKSIERREAGSRIALAAMFTAVRATAIGMLGAMAALIGAQFAVFQTSGGVVLGLLYIALGLLYLTGKIGWLARRIGPSLSRASGARSAAMLGLLFAFNIPACATPLLAALLGSAAVSGAGRAFQGFVMLGLFGLALTLPIMAAVFFTPMRRAMDWLAGLTRRVPVLIGGVLLALGAWSLYMSLSIQRPA